jgi:hypothetical protein
MRLRSTFPLLAMCGLILVASAPAHAHAAPPDSIPTDRIVDDVRLVTASPTAQVFSLHSEPIVITTMLTRATLTVSEWADLYRASIAAPAVPRLSSPDSAAAGVGERMRSGHNAPTADSLQRPHSTHRMTRRTAHAIAGLESHGGPTLQGRQPLGNGNFRRTAPAAP